MEYKDISGVVITFLAIGILTGIGMLVLSDFGEQVGEHIIVDNDTFIAINGTWVDLTHDYFYGDPIQCQNTTGEIIPTAYYEVNQTAGAIREIINGTMGSGPGAGAVGDVNCDYYYINYNASAGLAVLQTNSSLLDFTGWFSIIIIVLAASIIIGLVVSAFRQ